MSDENKTPEIENYEPDILVLEDENGVEHTFEVIDATDIEDERYLALVPWFEDPSQALEEDAEMIIMRVAEDGGEEVLDIVDDEDELQMVGSVFLNRLEELYEIDLEALEQE